MLDLLGNDKSTLRDCERKLITLLTTKNVELVSALLKNRNLIFYGTILAKAQSSEQKEAIRQTIIQMKDGKALI